VVTAPSPRVRLGLGRGLIYVLHSFFKLVLVCGITRNAAGQSMLFSLKICSRKVRMRNLAIGGCNLRLCSSHDADAASVELIAALA
jgi:hypothetical protein